MSHSPIRFQDDNEKDSDVEIAIFVIVIILCIAWAILSVLLIDFGQLQWKGCKKIITQNSLYQSPLDRIDYINCGNNFHEDTGYGYDGKNWIDVECAN